MTPVDLVVLQTTAVPGDVDANVARLVDDIARHGPSADLIVAPELATTGYDLDVLRARGMELAEPVDGSNLTRIAAMARRTQVTVVVGFLESGDGAIFDSVAVMNPDGSTTVYRKSHLYPAEVGVFAAGEMLTTVSTPAGLLGPLICFEHAFPDVATTLALSGAEILVIPSAVPFGFEYLLELRTRARAQDNQVFAVGANLAGTGFCGRSLVADPRGEVLVAGDADETVLHTTLDLAAITAERAQEPALRLRRPPLYGSEHRES